jgi:hypothetical protein
MFNPEIRVTEIKVEVAGSCNSCRRHPNIDPDCPPTVYDLELNSCSVRLCKDCLGILRPMIERIFADIMDKADSDQDDDC